MSFRGTSATSAACSDRHELQQWSSALLGCLQCPVTTNAQIEVTNVHEGRVHDGIHIPVPCAVPVPLRVWMGIYMRSGGARHAKYHIIINSVLGVVIMNIMSRVAIAMHWYHSLHLPLPPALKWLQR